MICSVMTHEEGLHFNQIFSTAYRWDTNKLTTSSASPQKVPARLYHQVWSIGRGTAAGKNQFLLANEAKFFYVPTRTRTLLFSVPTESLGTRLGGELLVLWK